MTDTPAERREAAATRRRWITLAEIVAVAGVLIGAAGLWINWSDRRADEARTTAAAQSEARDRARLDVTGEVRDGRTILLKDERHDIQSARFVFPAILGVAPQAPAGDPVIDADWLEEALLKATDGGADEKSGRLPVLATLRYWDGDRARETTAIYDIVWSTHGRALRSRALTLDGLKLRQQGGSAAALTRLWSPPRG